MLRKPAVILAAVCAAAAATLVAPSGAFACTSASCVYTQQSLGAGGGGKSGNSATQTPTHVSKNVISKVSRAGKDAAALKNIASNPSLGTGRDRRIAAIGKVASPSAFGAIFDLGTGPLALIAILVGSAVLVLAAAGWRGWQRWRSTRLAV